MAASKSRSICSMAKRASSNLPDVAYGQTSHSLGTFVKLLRENNRANKANEYNYVFFHDVCI